MKIKVILPALIAVILLTSFTLNTIAPAPKSTKGMIKVTILYPNGEGKTFDMDYYATKHMPLVSQLMGDALKNVEIDKGIASGNPNEAMPYLAIGYLYFDTLEDYQNAIGPAIEKIRADFPNYTNIRPIVQISEVVQ